MALSANVSNRYREASAGYAEVVSGATIYLGGALGFSSGEVRPLQAGDPFAGFAEQFIKDNGGSVIGVVYKRAGGVLLAITSAAVTDIGKDVFASGDDTFTFTQGSNTRIGFVESYDAASGKVWVELQTVRSDITELTDSTGGTATGTLAAATNIAALTDSTGGAKDNTLEAVGATNSGDVSSAINNNFAELTEELTAQRALNTVLINAVASLGAKVNELVRNLGG